MNVPLCAVVMLQAAGMGSACCCQAAERRQQEEHTAEGRGPGAKEVLCMTSCNEKLSLMVASNKIKAK